MRNGVLLVLALVLAIGVAFAGVYVHSRRQLPELRNQQVYDSPEEGMHDVIAHSYLGLQRVEIVHAGPDLPLLDNLWFVEARVWADRRADGKAMTAEWDNPGCFFVRLEKGWVLVPENRCPELLALGMRLFRQARSGS